MCLIDSKKFRVTIFPRKVYKIVKIGKLGLLTSPYRGTPITPIMRGNSKIKPTYLRPFTYSFEGGFIHAYTNRETAEKKLSVFRNIYGPKYTIIEGHIPFFTRYAIENSEVCAREIIFDI